MKKAEIKPPSEFSRRFAGHLAGHVERLGITQGTLASDLGRTQAYVSERLRGVRSPDTDLVSVIAQRAGLTPRELVSQILHAMKVEDGPSDQLAGRRRRKYSEVQQEAARNEDDE